MISLCYNEIVVAKVGDALRTYYLFAVTMNSRFTQSAVISGPGRE